MLLYLFLTLKKPIAQQQPPPAPATPVAQPIQTTTPVASGRKKTSRKGTGLSTTGYTIFSAEHNKQVNDFFFRFFFDFFF